MKCFNGSKDVAQPEPEMLHFRHMVRLFVFLLLPRKLERQQQKGVDTEMNAETRCLRRASANSIAAHLKRSKVIMDQMEKNKLLMAHSKRIARIFEICLVMLKGGAKGRGQSASGRYKCRVVGRRGHERLWLSVRMLL